MKVYVATKWENRFEASYVMGLLRDKGHEITCDWTVVSQESSAQAEADRDGVLNADVLIFLAGPDGLFQFKGAWVEFGIAVARNIPIFVVGTGADRNIFSRLPNVRKFGSFNELPMLLDYAN